MDLIDALAATPTTDSVVKLSLSNLFGRTYSSITALKNFPARPDTTIDWLNKSRDDWKNKTQTTFNPQNGVCQFQDRIEEGCSF